MQVLAADTVSRLPSAPGGPIAALVVVVLALLAVPGAAIAATDCDALYRQLDARHAKASATPAGPGTPRDQALRALEQVIFEAFEACPDNALLFTLMGEVQISLGQVPLAMAYGQKAISLDSGEWRAHHLLGSVLAMTGDHERGIAELTRAVELSDGRPRVRLNLASAQVWAGRYAEALPELDALAQDPDPVVVAAASHLRGKAHLGLGDVEQARVDFARAIDLGYQADRYEVPRSAIER